MASLKHFIGSNSKVVGNVLPSDSAVTVTEVLEHLFCWKAIGFEMLSVFWPFLAGKYIDLCNPLALTEIFWMHDGRLMKLLTAM